LSPREKRARLAVVGIGNPLAGDDGAGLAVIERLRALSPPDPRILLLTLEGDLFGIADHLHRAARFVFVDAVAGDRPGAVVRAPTIPAALAPSFHQTDIGAVMRRLEAIEPSASLPPWEIWGITIDPPKELRFGLSSVVEAAVERLAGTLAVIIAEAVASAGRR
jgi:hydrogenase maturation protease